MSGLEMPRQSSDEDFEQLLVDMDENMFLPEQMQQHMQQIRKKYRNNNNILVRILQQQKQALYRLAIIQIRLEAFEGVDLKKSYLKIKDQRFVLNNLYRIITPKGHAK
ncbi:hypothetical protein BGZ65_008037 [Modicella reniformis]|uniref:Uncharacterized protein n=1 Tax=Modicella reniformis TaxID=1440133 RepID=A0A9P6MB71_9FUNG|nr:hypothetical protein BGZ65_008037 [Modicella reniformis]